MPDTFWNLFLGYSVLWGLIAAYVFFLGRDCRRLRASVTEIEGELRQLESHLGSPARGAQQR